MLLVSLVLLDPQGEWDSSFFGSSSSHFVSHCSCIFFLPSCTPSGLLILLGEVREDSLSPSGDASWSQISSGLNILHTLFPYTLTAHRRPLALTNQLLDGFTLFLLANKRRLMISITGDPLGAYFGWRRHPLLQITLLSVSIPKSWPWPPTPPHLPSSHLLSHILSLTCQLQDSWEEGGREFWTEALMIPMEEFSSQTIQ